MTILCLDLKSLKCPLPALHSQKYISKMNFGEEVMIEATDPLSQIDIPHIIAQSKAQLISASEKNGIFIFHVKCNKTLGQ